MSKKILVIDDDQLVARSLARLLENEGFTLSWADNGEKALEIISENEFDLIISDIRLPGMDGIEINSRIKNHLKEKNKKEIPVIFITGYSDEKSYNEAQNLNPSDFIYKPFDKEKFIGSIKSAIREGAG